MKTIIGENKLHDVISKYIDDYLEGNEINWTYGYGGYATENEYGGLEENESFIIFYNGDCTLSRQTIQKEAVLSNLPLIVYYNLY